MVFSHFTELPQEAKQWIAVAVHLVCYFGLEQKENM